MRRYDIEIDWWKLARRLVLIAIIGAVFVVGIVIDCGELIGVGMGLSWGILIGRELVGKPIHAKRRPEAPHE